MHTESFPTEGGEIFIAFRGAQGAGRPAIVFLHGWTLDWRMWRPQLGGAAEPGLSEAGFTLALDRRGFGQSSAPPDLTAEADDIRAVLDRFQIGRAFIVGMSQAARVAVDFSLRFRDRLQGLVLHGPPAIGAADPAAQAEIPLADLQRLARNGRLAELRALWAAHPLMQAHSPDARFYVAEALASYRARDLAIDGPDHAWPYVDPSEIKVPTLAIAGERDTPMRRAAARALAAAIPGALHREIQGGGHLCNMCAPAAYNAVLGEFLTARL